MPRAAAVAAATVRKLCDLNCLGHKLQKRRELRSHPLILAFVTGMLVLHRNKRPVAIPRTNKVCLHELKSAVGGGGGCS